MFAQESFRQNTLFTIGYSHTVELEPKNIENRAKMKFSFRYNFSFSRVDAWPLSLCALCCHFFLCFFFLFFFIFHTVFSVLYIRYVLCNIDHFLFLSTNKSYTYLSTTTVRDWMKMSAHIFGTLKNCTTSDRQDRMCVGFALLDIIPMNNNQQSVWHLFELRIVWLRIVIFLFQWTVKIGHHITHDKFRH